MILLVTGTFLLIIAVGVMHVFPEKHFRPIYTASVPVKTNNKPSSGALKPDTLQAILTDADTISNMFTGLDSFYQSVQQVQTNHALLHIAYFGDSMIEGDLVTQPLRRYMQRRFGGNGIGFIPVTSPLPEFRTTIRQSFNDNWNVYSFVHPGNSKKVFPGISGYVYISEKGAETKYESPPGCSLFHTAEIIYGGKNNITLDVMTDTSSQVISLTPLQAVCSFTVIHDSAFSVF